ncbi:hypothetical protein NJ7G_1433 [Natrinema sp. J7-2]|nr:hypothetical protein NJ7G_1433 [Natrinema sp. J7-2]
MHNGIETGGQTAGRLVDRDRSRPGRGTAITVRSRPWVPRSVGARSVVVRRCGGVLVSVLVTIRLPVRNNDQRTGTAGPVGRGLLVRSAAAVGPSLSISYSPRRQPLGNSHSLKDHSITTGCFAACDRQGVNTFPLVLAASRLFDHRDGHRSRPVSDATEREMRAVAALET